MLSLEKRQILRQLADGVPEGPWRASETDLYTVFGANSDSNGNPVVICNGPTSPTGYHTLNDAAFRPIRDFIAAARLAVPKLLDHIEELERQLSYVTRIEALEKSVKALSERAEYRG